MSTPTRENQREPLKWMSAFIGGEICDIGGSPEDAHRDTPSDTYGDTDVYQTMALEWVLVIDDVYYHSK